MNKRADIIKYLTKELDKAKNQHKDNMGNINDNFLFYFAWRAEDAYVSAYIAHEITIMLTALDEKNGLDLTTYFGSVKERYIDILTTRPAMESSSSHTHNLCSLWGTQARQQILKMVNRCLEILFAVGIHLD